MENTEWFHFINDKKNAAPIARSGAFFSGDINAN